MSERKGVSIWIVVALLALNTCYILLQSSARERSMAELSVRSFKLGYMSAILDEHDNPFVHRLKGRLINVKVDSATSDFSYRMYDRYKPPNYSKGRN